MARMSLTAKGRARNAADDAKEALADGQTAFAYRVRENMTLSGHAVTISQAIGDVEAQGWTLSLVAGYPAEKGGATTTLLIFRVRSA